MKPQLLLLLLLAIPPLISNILACESAEKTDAPLAAKSGIVNRESPGATSTPTTPAPSSVAPATLVPKARPASGTGTSTGLKAWFIM